MSTVLDRNALRIQETASVLEAGSSGGAVDADGNVMIHLIRPCVGKGRGRHVYEADMLKRHAESGHFNDWPMFVDHESPKARRAAGGLPRSLRDIGGRVVETSWDESVPAGDGFGQGAVLAKVKPVPWIAQLIEHDPKLAAVSVNTFATGVRPTQRGGRPAYIVEGFDNDGSVDWVTKAGAGGRVVQLMEAAYEEGYGMDDAEMKRVMEAMPDDRLAELLKDKRPAVAETLLNNADHGEEDDVKPEELREAVHTELRSDETKTIIAEAVSEAVNDGEAVKDAVSEALREVLPGAIGKAAGVIEESAKTAATHAVRMGALRDKAEDAVQEAQEKKGLPERFGQEVLERIGTPDLQDKTDDDGKVTESAEDQFDTLLEAELKRANELVEAARPAPAATRRRARTAVTENGNGGEGTDPNAADAIQEAEEEEPGEYRHALQEAGVDVYAAYGLKKPKTEKEKADDKAAREREAATA